MLNYQRITIFFALRLFSSRFFASFRFRLHCLNLSKNIAFLAAFLAVLVRFIAFVCVYLYRQKRPLFWPFLRLNFSMHPQPLIDPHRDRGCLSEKFFFIFFLFIRHHLSASLQKFCLFFFIWLPTHISVLLLFIFLKMRRCFIWLLFDCLLNLKFLLLIFQHFVVLFDHLFDHFVLFFDHFVRRVFYLQSNSTVFVNAYK